MKMTVKRETTFQFDGQLTLEDLRNLVDECAGLYGGALVSVAEHFGQRDAYEGMTITVHGA